MQKILNEIQNTPIHVSALLRSDVASLGILFPTFQVHSVVSVSRIESRKNKGQEPNTQRHSGTCQTHTNRNHIAAKT
jgi:hypothetical protein